MSNEKELLRSIENGEWQPVKNREGLMKELQKIAVNTQRKDQRMNIRINSRDLLQLKAKALEEGIPYQTLVGSLIHKYLSGQLVEKQR